MNSTITLTSRLRLLSIWILLILCLALTFYLLPKDLNDLTTYSIIGGFVLLLFTVPFRLAQYQLAVNFSSDSIMIGDQQHNWSELKSYNATYSQYIETLTIRLHNGKKIQLTGLVDGRKSKEFQKQKHRFMDLVESHNQKNETFKILETGFYNSRFAKVYIVIVGLIGLIGVFAFFLGGFKNPIPLLLVLVFLGVIIPQMFNKRKTNANTK